MSILYNAIARSILISEARALIEPSSPPAADPVLGYPPEIVYRWNTFGKKHGKLVEQVMTKVIQSNVGWQPASQTRFKCDTDKTKKLIDRIAINRQNEVAIFVECKRNLGNVSGPYLESISGYDEWCRKKSSDIAKEIGLDPQKAIVRFVVFNAYGAVDDGRIVKGIPVLLPADLPSVFGLPVLEAFQELNDVVQSVVLENEAFRNLSSQIEHVPEQLAAAETLPQIAAHETPEQFRRRIGRTLDQLTSN